ncbi:MAG: GxxExxY protein [Armatimonadetes bacterium CG_4_10_14_3_um_filter_66_18]|nr:GxxExxY protein [Armatimonadota bacterium]OIO97369.1 MAG: Fe3+ hydroxamate ABC transporter substrate-binding protein [Armatimonadetes bacterium CG2_30_66_41]PIU92620.1 MAG: GxxExxY protein [Armatimonadetes bacterium CG06_land_8_20_14_3_00_66_21]PIX46483.1 MAG: GxxExxY protein [Armatimonadetes bacterium CG_4_8_14_3_um_filter_66_20]PIY50004.1 MAG: GxxExxY protein [Armatimonadetes bacterium CG_4_10_14_3_um_filter_66_18]PIZ37691.1 MAG: GxxExxY protein [Armatimonadetes bacterium CG_4_10_14_0_8_u
MHENDISGIIVNAAVEVHRALGGPGLLEGVYEEALRYELELRKLGIKSQTAVPLSYKGRALKTPLRLDILVEGKGVVEVKAVKDHHPIFESQVLTYLRLLDLRLGLVINFGVRRVAIDGIARVVNGLEE